jgi:tRNA threonylcarbamoyl adenosine modification protein (Sua5/YciO/YrdC/YwlC family)
MKPEPIGDAVGWVRDGGLLAYPTETVWGLGADSRSDSAVARLNHWKGRDASVPISILVADIDCLASLGFELTDTARCLAAAFWPGPLTLVLNCEGRFARGVSRDDGAVGVRCSSHPLSLAIARRLATAGVGPLTATSLNRSGMPAAGHIEQAREMCGSSADSPRLVAVEGAEAGGDRESTVIDATGVEPRVLRWGAVAQSELARFLGALERSA